MTLTEFHRTCQKLDGGIDDQLASYMTVTGSMKQLADYGNQAAIAVGLKGIGKSSSFRYLTEIDQAVDIVIAINPDKFHLQLPSRSLSIATCRKQFEHDLVFEALRGVIRHARDVSNARIDSSLIKDAKKAVGYYTNLLRSIFKNAELEVSFLGIGFTLKGGTASTAAGLTKEDEIGFAKKTLANICRSGVRIRIVVDDPEEVFSVNRALDVAMVGGFCLAALRLSAEIPNLKIIALLKSHVYHPVNRIVEDFSKYPDHKAALAWTRDELSELIEKRLLATNLEWHDLFTDSTENQAMTVLTRKIRNGPRDLLRWLDLALKESVDTPISLHHVNNTYERMSQDAFQEFSRAYSASYDGLSQLVRIIFARQVQTTFAPEEFKQHLTKLWVRDKGIKALQSQKWLQQINVSLLPPLLLNAAAISFKSKNRIVLPYEMDYTEEHLEQATQVCLTPCFVPAIASLF